MKKRTGEKTHYLAQAGIIGAVYALLTVVLAPVSFGPVQVRIAEALCVLPYFTPAAVPGLFVGCVVANLASPYGIPDLIFGSSATLIGAFLSYRIGRMASAKPETDRLVWLLPLPAVFANGILVALVIALQGGLQFKAWLGTALWIGLGELLSGYLLGMPLWKLLKKQESLFTL